MRIDRPAPGEDLNTGAPTVPRPSASVIVLRDGEGGPEVLLVRRNPQQRFMGGAWVFPGGATAAEDGDERATAVRELREEAGVDLPEGHELVRFSRWITPAQVRVRFDTHFFVTAAPADAAPAVDGSECVDWRWSAPRAALEAFGAGDLTLVFPTIRHLEQLTAFGSVADALASARERRVLPVEPRVLVEGGVARVVLPGEDGYDA